MDVSATLIARSAAIDDAHTVARVVPIRLVTRSASHFFRRYANDFAPIRFCLKNAWILCSLTDKSGNSVPAKNAKSERRKRNQNNKEIGSNGMKNKNKN